MPTILFDNCFPCLCIACQFSFLTNAKCVSSILNKKIKIILKEKELKLCETLKINALKCRVSKRNFSATLLFSFQRQSLTVNARLRTIIFLFFSNFFLNNSFNLKFKDWFFHFVCPRFKIAVWNLEQKKTPENFYLLTI